MTGLPLPGRTVFAALTRGDRLPSLARHWPLLIPPAMVSFLRWQPATQGPTACPFALVSGYACPLCGGTRAAAALLTGDLAQAWAMHPIIFIIVPLMVAAYARWLMVRSGRRSPVRAATVNRVLFVLGLAMIGVWAVRALSGTLPAV